MYIDLHCHTLKCKIGDPVTRSVDSTKFSEAIKNKGVSIVAITNHNYFDKSQYLEFSKVSLPIQVWPGIELDIEGETSKGHCIAISHPNQVDSFSVAVDTLLSGTSPDKFVTNFDDLIQAFSNLNVLFIAHFMNKQPALNDSDIELLKSKIGDRSPLLVEVQNLRSAGIMIAHNINTIIGSDVRDWDKYQDCELPELKLDIDSFDRFRLLLKKDSSVIKTFVDQKLEDALVEVSFLDCRLKLKIYNDINIFFGGKGTGKTEILKELKKHYEIKGSSDVSCYFAEERDKDFSKISTVKCKEEDYELLKLDDDTSVYSDLLSIKEPTVTPMTQFVKWKESLEKQALEKKFGFLRTIISGIGSESVYQKSYSEYEIIKESNKKLLDLDLSQYLTTENERILRDLMKLMLHSSKELVKKDVCEFFGQHLENRTIEIMKQVFKSKSGVEAKPSGTGLLKVFSNCQTIRTKSNLLLSTINTGPKIIKTVIGSLPDKGHIYLEKTISVNPDTLTGKSQFYNKSTNITNLKKIKTCIRDIVKNSNKGSAYEIKTLHDLLEENKIKNSKDMFGVFGRLLKETGQEYTPSNGEQHMLILSHSLMDDTKNVFILDEPEMGVGHNYINRIIIPRLKYLSRINKKVLISTHDANIAIRTLPFQSIYRLDCGGNVYKTYIGSPFLDEMTEYKDPSDKILWSKTSLETLEGGKEAFGERGEAYGNDKY